MSCAPAMPQPVRRRSMRQEHETSDMTTTLIWTGAALVVTAIVAFLAV